MLTSPPAGRTIGRRPAGAAGLRLIAGEAAGEPAAAEPEPASAAAQQPQRPAQSGNRSPAARLVSKEETERARKLCLDELERSPRTRVELAVLLVKREVAPDVAEAVLGRFEEAGLIDDALFAQLWVSSRHESKGLASGQLRQELRRKGIDDETIDEAVSGIDADDERATARALIERKQQATRGLDPQVRMRRLAGLLARKGYPAGVAFAVVREALAEEGLEIDAPDD